MKAYLALQRIGAELDRETIEKLHSAARSGFRWLRFENESVRIVIPATRDCAERVLRDEKTKKWLSEVRALVSPLDLEADPEGLALIVGKGGKPIRLTHQDDRSHKQEWEKHLLLHAGEPRPALIDGKSADAEQLIEQFLAEQANKQ